MARLLERRRAEIDEATRSEADAVALVRSRLEAQLKDRDAELSRVSTELVGAGAARDRAMRECRVAQMQVQRVTEAADTERRRLQSTMEDQAARLEATGRALDEATRVAREATVRASLDTNAASIDARSAADRLAEARSEAEQLRGAVADLETRLSAARDGEASAKRKLADATRTLGEAQARAAAAAEEAATQRERDRRLAEKRTASLQDEVLRLSERSSQLAASLDHASRAAAADVRSSIVRFESDLSGQVRSTRRLCAWPGALYVGGCFIGGRARAGQRADELEGARLGAHRRPRRAAGGRTRTHAWRVSPPRTQPPPAAARARRGPRLAGAGGADGRSGPRAPEGRRGDRLRAQPAARGVGAARGRARGRDAGTAHRGGALASQRRARHRAGREPQGTAGRGRAPRRRERCRGSRGTRPQPAARACAAGAGACAGVERRRQAALTQPCARGRAGLGAALLTLPCGQQATGDGGADAAPPFRRPRSAGCGSIPRASREGGCGAPSRGQSRAATPLPRPRKRRPPLLRVRKEGHSQEAAAARTHPAEREQRWQQLQVPGLCAVRRRFSHACDRCRCRYRSCPRHLPRPATQPGQQRGPALNTGERRRRLPRRRRQRPQQPRVSRHSHGSRRPAPAAEAGAPRPQGRLVAAGKCELSGL